MEVNKIKIPIELNLILENEDEARDFFINLSDGYKKGYCDWVSGSKNENTRKNRAEKALLMLKNKQKTLKTVK